MKVGRSILKKTFAYRFWKHYKKNLKKAEEEKKIISEWNSKGRPVPPPQLHKRGIIKEYALRFNVKTFMVYLK